MLTHISLSSLKVLGQSQNNIYSLISPVSKYKQYWSQQNAINQPEEVCCVILVGDSHPAVTVYNRVLEFYNINSSCQDRSLYNNGWRLLVCSFHHRPAHPAPSYTDLTLSFNYHLNISTIPIHHNNSQISRFKLLKIQIFFPLSPIFSALKSLTKRN